MIVSASGLAGVDSSETKTMQRGVDLIPSVSDIDLLSSLGKPHTCGLVRLKCSFYLLLQSLTRERRKKENDGEKDPRER